MRKTAVALAVALFLSLLAGCETTPEIVEMKVAVPVACTEPIPERPHMVSDTMEKGLPVDVQSRYLRSEIDTREGYEIKLLTALQNCRAPIEAQ